MNVDGPDVFDVIIVLGAAQMPDDTPGPIIERRVAVGAKLWHEKKAPYILLSGGSTVSETPEAHVMAEVAKGAGVADDAITMEETSTRTLENAVFSIEIMRARGWKRALLVTDDFHMARAVYCFTAMRMWVSPVPVRNQLDKTIFFCWCREIIGRFIYPRQIRAYQGRF